MARYPKLFIAASLIYVMCGVSVGVMNAVGWGHIMAMRFTHIHFNLLGFMMMMIFGVGYHILPRFFANDIPWPRLVPVHFYLQNIGILGLVGSYWFAIAGQHTEYRFLLAIFGCATAISILFFVANMLGSMAAETPARITSARRAVERRPARPIRAQMRVSEALARGPAALQFFVSSGFGMLANPVLRATMAPMVTIEAACRKHGIEDVDGFVRKLNHSLGNPDTQPSVERGDSADAVNGDMLIRDVLERHPETMELFKELFGEGCFDCPGQAHESLTQAAKLHGIDPAWFVESLNTRIETGAKPEGRAPPATFAC